MSTAKSSFVVRREAMLAALQDAGRVARNGKPIPILGSILVTIASDRLTWFATDTEISRAGEVAVTASQPGRGLLPVELTLGFLKRCSEDEICFTIDGEKVALTAGRFSAKWTTEQIADFPVVPEMPVGSTALSRAALSRAALPTMPIVAATATSGKYYLKGALVSVDAQGVTCVATDGHRLCRVSVPCDTAGVIPETIVPIAGMSELLHVLKAEGDESVHYVVAASGAYVFAVGDQRLVVRPLDLQFPAWKRIIPTSTMHAFVCDREVLLAAVRRVAVAADGERLAIALAIDGDTVTLNASSVRHGEASEPLALQSHEGAPVTFMLDSRYLAECLESFDGASVRCEIKDEASPVLFKRATEKDTDWLYVVMAMRR